MAASSCTKINNPDFFFLSLLILGIVLCDHATKGDVIGEACDSFKVYDIRACNENLRSDPRYRGAPDLKAVVPILLDDILSSAEKSQKAVTAISPNSTECLKANVQTIDLIKYAQKVLYGAADFGALINFSEIITDLYFQCEISFFTLEPGPETSGPPEILGPNSSAVVFCGILNNVAGKLKIKKKILIN